MGLLLMGIRLVHYAFIKSEFVAFLFSIYNIPEIQSPKKINYNDGVDALPKNIFFSSAYI